MRPRGRPLSLSGAGLVDAVHHADHFGFGFRRHIERARPIEARYFGLGKIGRDQVKDYAKRRGVTVDQAESWLAPNLAYER